MRWARTLTRLAAFSILMIAASSSSKADPVARWEAFTCEAYDSVVTPDGVAFNNVWNSKAAEGLPWEQCLVRSALRRGYYGWIWSWPKEKDDVFGYPHIRYGASPWSPEPSFGNDMPIRLLDIEGFRVAHKLTTIKVYRRDRFNTAVSLWIGEGATPQPEAIRAEVAIWTNYGSIILPAGQKKKTVNLGNELWEVWLAESWYELPETGEHRWALLTFRKFSPTWKEVEIDVAALLNYGIEQGYLEADWYAFDVELGQELSGGYGETIVDRFDVVIER